MQERKKKEMFKLSQPCSTTDPTSNILAHLDTQTAALLVCENSWHQVFYQELVSVFPEQPFSVLYPSALGRPNSPIRQMVGMMILKEGHGWTDEQLFEEVIFNYKVRWSLGLRNLNDKAPSSSTYYSFRHMLHHHYEIQGEDLLEQAFEQITTQQLEKYNINGRNFRMDSKLYNSNIATSSLVRLLAETIQLFLRDLPKDQYNLIDSSFSALLSQITKGSSDGITYQMTKVDKTCFIASCGDLLLHLRAIFVSMTNNTAYSLLVRLLEEQYEIIETQPQLEQTTDLPASIEAVVSTETVVAPVPEVQLKARKLIKGNTLQSPHDPQAAYRKKENGGHVQQVRGYSSNIGETCSKKDPFDLITTITTKPVTAADNDFVLKSIEQAQRVAGKIDYSWQDGAYSSAINRTFFEAEEITAYFPALAGKQSFYLFEWQVNKEQPTEKVLVVTDTRNNRTYTAIPHTDKKGNQLYKIYEQQFKNGQFVHFYRYFSQQAITNFFKRQSIEQIPKEILDRRAGIEATIWQVFCKYGKKTRYRGLIANHHMVLGRCFWTNCQRITKYLTKKAKKQLIFTFLRLCRFTSAQNAKMSILGNLANLAIWQKITPNFIRLCQGTFCF